MCLVLLPTSLAKHSHSYDMDSEIPYCIVTYTVYFALAQP